MDQRRFRATVNTYVYVVTIGGKGKRGCENVILIFKLLILGVGEGIAALPFLRIAKAAAFQVFHIFFRPLAGMPLQHHQVLRLFHRQHAQHHGINRTENGGVGPNAQRQ